MREICGEDKDLQELLDGVTNNFYEYTDILLRYNILLLEEESFEKSEKLSLLDDERKIKHNTMIDSVNILARNIGSKGKDNSWISKINTESRNDYSRLALMNTYFELIKQEQEKENKNKQRSEAVDTQLSAVSNPKVVG
ncbi:MAG: hypothetical protein ABIJ81_03020 [Patescibacteria group bacterium]